MHHLYVIGRTGVGKSTLLETLALQDIHAGHGIALIDPHGDLVRRIAGKIPKERLADLVYLDAPDPNQPYGYNPLRGVRADKVGLAVGGLLDALKKLWSDSWGVRMEHILRNALYALIEYGDATLDDLALLLVDKSFGQTVLSRVENEAVRLFWQQEFARYNPRYRQEAIAPIQNKIGAFLADRRLHRILTAPLVDLHFREIMDKGKILLVNLSKGHLGEDGANLLGALLVSTLSLAAFSRAEMAEEARRPFFLYVDEFQNFTTLSVANMVSELRKYAVGLTLAHQHLHQLEPEVRHAVLANMGSMVAFRMGVEDSHVIAREFEPVFDPHDLVNLPNHNVYLKLMIDGMPSRAFSATTLHPDQLAT
jgi:DNA helicase HerA-like ATPase